MKTESLAYWAVRAFSAFIRILPIAAAIGFGRFIGTVGYYLDSRHKKVAYSNLKIAFARHKKASEIKRIVRRLYAHFGQHVVELMRLPVTDPHRYIQVEGKEHVDSAIKKGKGVILLAMHFGSWELCNFMEKLLGYPYRVMVNPQSKHSRLDDLLSAYRQSAGANLILSSGSGTKDFLKSLKNNEIVGIVVDQGGRTGALVKFFGRLASMSIGAVKIAIKLDVSVCFCVILHEQGPHHRLIIHPAIEFTRTGDMEKDIRVNLDHITQTMQDYITRYPWQYMWLYKIWKYSKESTIVILNDGRTGHLRQSQAVAKHLVGGLSERGINSDVQVIDIEFKDDWRKKLFVSLAFINSQKFSQGRLRYLKWFLKRKSYLEVMSVKGDFVISCGSSTAGVNYFLSHDYRAKSIVIQRPGALKVSNFDLVILPEHDRRHIRKPNERIVFTKLAPNLVNEDYVHEQAQRLVAKFPVLEKREKPIIGVLLGGESKTHTIDQSQIQMMLAQVFQAAQRLDAQVMVTTSRRTGVELEEFIGRQLHAHSRCLFFINASKNNVPEAVGGLLGLSDIVIVSSDSISMVSESVASGKKVIVIPVQRKNPGKKTKHEIFIDQLKQGAHITVSPEYALAQAIIRASKEEVVQNPVSDQETLQKAIRGLI